MVELAPWLVRELFIIITIAVAISLLDTFFRLRAMLRKLIKETLND